uniref:Acetate kinase n=1 Tax=Physcomitrium patens TaxID=3218 RepID=A0A7I4DSN9_PHYPA
MEIEYIFISTFRFLILGWIQTYYTTSRAFKRCWSFFVLDTAFHSTMLPAAYHYAIPYNLYEELGIRKYGFHGTSYQYLLQQSLTILEKPQSDVNIVALHLGARASMAAIKNGMNVDVVINILNKKNMLFGLCGKKDMRYVWNSTEAGNARHKLALQVYVHWICSYLGAYYFHLQENLDALVFSTGIGEGAGQTRARICEGLEKFGIEVD